jgi:outer membrane immunogenic protein
MKKFLLAVTAFVTIGGSALAADVPVRRQVPTYGPPPVVALFTWTGCYVGGNAGGLWARTEWHDDVFGDFGTGTASGGLGGLQVGCNYQTGPWVFGIQGDYDWTNATNDTTNVFLTNFTGFAVTNHREIDSLASVTGRVGYAIWDRFLAYVKGGGAWVNGSASLQFAGVTTATASTTRGGWTVGVGGEYAFTNWLTGFVEWDHYGFERDNPSGLVCTPTRCRVFVGNNLDITTNINVVKAGLNLKFGPGGFAFGY